MGCETSSVESLSPDIWEHPLGADKWQGLVSTKPTSATVQESQRLVINRQQWAGNRGWLASYRPLGRRRDAEECPSPALLDRTPGWKASHACKCKSVWWSPGPFFFWRGSGAPGFAKMMKPSYKWYS